MNTLFKVVATLVVVGVMVHSFYLGLAVAVVVVVFGWRGYLQAWDEMRAERERKASRRARLAADLDAQDAWYIAGDPRGVHGKYPV